MGFHFLDGLKFPPDFFFTCLKLKKKSSWICFFKNSQKTHPTHPAKHIFKGRFQKTLVFPQQKQQMDRLKGGGPKGVRCVSLCQCM